MMRKILKDKKEGLYKGEWGFMSVGGFRGSVVKDIVWE